MLDRHFSRAEVNPGQSPVIPEHRRDDLGFHVSYPAIQLRPFGQIILAIGAGTRIADHGLDRRLHRTGKNAVQRVIIGLRNRVKFVVVATGARDCQAEKGLRGHVNAVVDDLVGIPVEVVAYREKAQRRQGALVAAAVQLVGSELFQDEPVVGLVVVERFDDVIPVGPRIRVNGTLAAAIKLALRVRVSRHVEPMPTPALAVMRGGQQFVHELFKRVRRIVREKILHLFGCWRQSDQIIVNAANQRALVRRFVRRHAVFLEPRQNKLIHIVPNPGLILDGGRPAVFDWLESPVILAIRAIGRSLPCWTSGARIGRAQFDPGD